MSPAPPDPVPAGVSDVPDPSPVEVEPAWLALAPLVDDDGSTGLRCPHAASAVVNVTSTMAYLIETSSIQSLGGGSKRITSVDFAQPYARADYGDRAQTPSHNFNSDFVEPALT